MKQPIRAAALCLALCAIVSVAAAQQRTHTVQKGETVYAIARRYGVTVDAIAAANGIKDAAKVQAGTVLTIPGAAPKPAAPAAVTPPAAPAAAPAAPGAAAVIHLVRKGETLFAISRRYGVGVDAIAKANKLVGTVIREGQRLTIPGAAVATTPPASDPAARAPQAAAKPASAIATVGTWPAAGELSFLQGKLRGASIAVRPGDSISAIRGGTVVSTGPFRSFANVAFVQSADGLMYVYGGAGELLVGPGDAVRKGSLVGRAAPDGDGKAAVYFLAFRGAESLDPKTVPRD